MYVFRNSSVKRFVQIPSLSIGSLNVRKYHGKPKMLIGRLVTQQLISSSVDGVGSLIDGSQNSVWTVGLADEFPRIMKDAIILEKLTYFI